MQVYTLSAQLGLESEPNDWYQDATAVPQSQFSIDLSPRTDDRLRFCSNTRSIPLKFCIPDRLKQSDFLDDKHSKSLYSPSVPIFFPQMQKSFPSVLPRRICQVPLRMYSKSSQKKPAEHKKTSRDIFSKRSLIALSKKKYLEAKKRRSGIEKGLHLMQMINPPVFIHLP